MSLLERILEIPLVYRIHSAMVDEAKTEALQAVRSDFEGLRVLDIGCGPGNNTALFKGAEYTGIDINPRYTRQAAQLYPTARFLTGDATVFELPGPFDLILMNSFFHHVDDEGVVAVCLAAARVLAKGGEVIMQEPLIPARGEYYHRFLMQLDRGDYFRSLEGWQNLAREGGLTLKTKSFYSLRVFGIRGYHMASLVFQSTAEVGN